MTDSQGPALHTDVEACVDAILAQVGKRIVLGLPLGLGKPNHLANALFARAVADPSIQLRILTALTFERNLGGPELYRRLVDPIIERLFGDFPELTYAQAVRTNRLPPNIQVSEFFFNPGRWLGAKLAQRSYIAVNYTEAARLLTQEGVNVIIQLVAGRGAGAGARYSLSCNADITLDLIPEVLARRGTDDPLVFACQTNGELPFMDGPAALPAATFDHVLSSPAYEFPLYAPPREAVTQTQYATAMHIAGLVKDGGALQIGIGALGDAIAWALMLRHQHNADFRDALGRLDAVVEDPKTLEPFDAGLYGVTEMFVPAFLELFDAGILKRRASDGAVLHAGFFVACKAFYKALRELPDAVRDNFRMTTVSFTNRLGLGGEDDHDRQSDRRNARFINSAMMATLMGDVISDRLEDGRVVSGVGGQFDFVAQAHMLEGARAIIALNATRTDKGRAQSNIRFSYGACTVPRHLRDMIVTEYGVADLRGKSDREVIAAMLNIADSRFQPALLAQAKASGKIETYYEIPDRYRANTPETLRQRLANARAQGLLPDYPFGTDLDPVEQRLVAALERLKAITGSRVALARGLVRTLGQGSATSLEAICLARIGLDRPQKLSDRITARLLLSALRELT